MSSPRTAERLRRLLSMIPYVLANQGVPVDELVVRFGYSDQRELLRDLDVVLVCGLPGYFPGDMIGAWVDDGAVVIDTAEYFAHAPRLTSAEALMLVAGGRALLASGVDVPALETGVAKLERALIGDDPVVTIDLGGEPSAAGTLRSAATENRVVRITYTSIATDETTTRDIEPWAVFSTLGNWYVSGYCRLAEAERTFRLDRIRELAPLDETFEPPVDPPVPAIRYTPTDDDVTAVIELEPQATWVADYYPVEEMAREGDLTRIRFSASDARVTARLLLRLGSSARLIEGAEVAAELAEMRRRILRKYGAS